MDVEELQLGIEKQLCEVSLDVLIGLAVFLKLEEPKYQGKSRLGVARAVRRDIEEQVAQFEDENECLSFVKEIRELILQKAEEETPLTGNGTQDKEPEVLENKLSDMAKEHQKQVETIQAKPTISKTPESDIKHVFRREFKIIGQIGEPG